MQSSLFCVVFCLSIFWGDSWQVSSACMWWLTMNAWCKMSQLKQCFSIQCLLLFLVPSYGFLTWKSAAMVHKFSGMPQYHEIPWNLSQDFSGEKNFKQIFFFPCVLLSTSLKKEGWEGENQPSPSVTWLLFSQILNSGCSCSAQCQICISSPDQRNRYIAEIILPRVPQRSDLPGLLLVQDPSVQWKFWLKRHSGIFLGIMAFLCLCIIWVSHSLNVCVGKWFEEKAVGICLLFIGTERRL